MSFVDLTAFKQKYPAYANIPDEILLTRIHEKYYPDVEFGEFLQKAGEKWGLRDEIPDDQLQRARSTLQKITEGIPLSSEYKPPEPGPPGKIQEAYLALGAGFAHGLTAGYIPDDVAYKYGTSRWAAAAGELAGMLVPLGVGGKIAGGVIKGTSAAAQLARNALTGGLFGAIRKKEEGESRFFNIIEDAAFFSALKGAHILGGNSALARMGLSTIPGAAITAAHGGSAGEIAASGLITGAFGLLPSEARLQKKLEKNFDEFIKDVRAGDPGAEARYAENVQKAQQEFEVARRQEQERMYEDLFKPVIEREEQREVYRKLFDEAERRAKLRESVHPEQKTLESSQAKIVPVKIGVRNIRETIPPTPTTTQLEAAYRRLVNEEIGGVKKLINESLKADPGIRPKLRAEAEIKLGQLEGGKKTERLPEIPDKDAAPPPEDAPFRVTEIPRAPGDQSIKNLDRIDRAYKEFLDAVAGEHEIYVRKSGERTFRPLTEGKGRLTALMETRQIEVRDVTFHRGGRKPDLPRMGDLTIRVGLGENERIYQIRRLGDRAETPVSRVEAAETSKELREAKRALHFVPPEMQAVEDFSRSIGRMFRGFFDTYFAAGETVLRSEPGKRLAREMTEAQEYTEVLHSQFVERALKAGLGRIGERRGINISDVIEGRAEPLNDDVARLAGEIRGLFKEAFQKIREADIKVKERVPYKRKNGTIAYKTVFRTPREVENYVPRIIRSEISHRVFNNTQKLIEELKKLQEGGASDQRLANIILEWLEKENPILKSETREALEMAIARGEHPLDALRNLHRFMGDELFRPVLYPRTSPFPEYFWERDMRILFPRYIQSISRRYGEAKIWGADARKMLDRLSEIARIDPDEAKRARFLLEVFTGKADIERKLPEFLRKAADLFFEYEMYSKIYAGTAAMPNALQFSISTIPKGGVWRFLKVLNKIATDPEYRKNISQKSAMHTMTRASLIFGGYDPRYGRIRKAIDRVMQKHPFNVFNRMQSYLAAAVGEDAIKDWYRIANSPRNIRRGFALRQLKRLGVDPKKPLTRDIIDRKMIRFVIDTQLLRNVLKDPLWANDPRYRVFFLFSRFGYKQFRFAKEEIVKELLNGNFLPLLRAAALGYLGGELVVWGKNRLREFYEGTASLIKYGKYEFVPRARMDRDRWWARAINNYAAIGSLGFFTDLFRVEDPTKYEVPPDAAKELYDNLKFIALPVAVNEIITLENEREYFVDNWRNRGIKAAVDRLKIDALKSSSPAGRYVSGGLTDEKRHFTYEMRRAIKSNNDRAIIALFTIASHRGLDPNEIFEKAIKQYKTEEARKINREFRIIEYNLQKQIQKSLRE
jgi:hypothetical protein